MIQRQAISLDLHSVIQDKIEQGMTEDQIIHAVNNIDEITKQRDQLLAACKLAEKAITLCREQLGRQPDPESPVLDLIRQVITQAERGAK